MKIRSWLAFASMTVLMVGCGDDEEDTPPAQPAEVNKQVAASTAQSTILALSATTSGTNAGASSVSSLASVAQSSQSLLQAQPGGATTQSIASAFTVADGIAPRDFDAPGCSCTETSCTFTNCSPNSGSQYSFTIDGTYSWAGGHVKCENLKYTFGGSNAGGAGTNIGISTKVAVTLNCDITITASSIKGFVQSAGSSSTEIAGRDTQGTYSSTWDIKTT
ncbi:MAG TPA: hypothetical protein VM925_04010, partial [Labilithrix sp.]|nr:hypothetical protein [Labilithrix sp.]